MSDWMEMAEGIRYLRSLTPEMIAVQDAAFYRRNRWVALALALSRWVRFRNWLFHNRVLWRLGKRPMDYFAERHPDLHQLATAAGMRKLGQELAAPLVQHIDYEGFARTVFKKKPMQN